MYLYVDKVFSVLDSVKTSVEDRMFSGCTGRPLCHRTKYLHVHTYVHGTLIYNHVLQCDKYE